MFLNRLKKKSDESRAVIVPPVDSFETEKEIVLNVELPGVARNSLHLEIKDDQLTVSANRMEDSLGTAYSSIYHERAAGIHYQRVFQVNTEIDRDKIQAVYDLGVLRIVLPKAQSALPQKIAISAT